jgi:ubiquinone/menaquinone biosynthesis C-methylase UbiE
MSQDTNFSSKKVIADHYNEQSKSYGRRYQGYKKQFFQSIEENTVIDLLSKKWGGYWLDVGTGEGRFSRAAVDFVERIIGIDISNGMIEIANKNNSNNQKIKFYQMDFISTTFPNFTFDAIISLGAFEYIDDLGPYLKEGYRVGKKNAKLVFTCHNNESIIKTKSNKTFAVQRHTINSLENLLVENGWRTVKIYSIFHISGRWIWIFCRLLPSFLRGSFIKALIRINKQLSKWPPTALKGRVLLICAEKN